MLPTRSLQTGRRFPCLFSPLRYWRSSSRLSPPLPSQLDGRNCMRARLTASPLRSAMRAARGAGRSDGRSGDPRLESCGERDPHQLGHAARAGLRHEIGAVDFDRAWRDVEVMGDGLVDLARHQALQHVALAWREISQPRLGLDLCGTVTWRRGMGLERRADGSEQGRVIEWLFEE